jgi:NhaP-type Na+/H+ or K+/H+ antiporter
MSIVPFLRSFLIIFVLVFIVTVVTTFLYGLIAHGTGLVDWESALRFGLILGISLPLVGRFEGKKLG